MKDDRDDDLFAPSLAGVQRGPVPEGERPWRVSSQFYVAFFGGPLAAAFVGVLNGRRLGLPSARLWGIAAAGAVALVVAAVAVAVFAMDAGRGPRLALIGSGVAAYALANRLQRDADRRYAAGRSADELYDSLWYPGIPIAIGLGLVSGLAIAGLT